MPSDEQMGIALRALAGPIERYRSAVVTTVEELRGYLSTHRRSGNNGDRSVAAGLGEFAAGRIDFDRFASIVNETRGEGDPEALGRVEKAFDVLRSVAAGGDDVFYVKVKPGTRLRDAVADRWAEVGRAFTAARVAAMAQAGSLSVTDEQFRRLEFESWNPAEREHSPPLIVELDGADLHAGDLTEFLDGSVKIVLLVNGDAAPAPLVRLITPSTFVMQTNGENGLDRFSAAVGPAVAAVMPDSAARFIHDPAAGDRPADRLEILYMPEEGPKRAVGGMSVRQQNDELEQLRELAGEPCEMVASGDGAAPAPASRPMTSVDKLAAWLLSRTDLKDVE